MPAGGGGTYCIYSWRECSGRARPPARAPWPQVRARLRLIERVARLTAGTNLSDEDEDRLNALCQGLVEEPSP